MINAPEATEQEPTVTEFWETAFPKMQLAWGLEPTVSAPVARDQFARMGVKDVLIPDTRGFHPWLPKQSAKLPRTGLRANDNRVRDEPGARACRRPAIPVCAWWLCPQERVGDVVGGQARAFMGSARLPGRYRLMESRERAALQVRWIAEDRRARRAHDDPNATSRSSRTAATSSAGAPTRSARRSSASVSATYSRVPLAIDLIRSRCEDHRPARGARATGCARHRAPKDSCHCLAR